MSLFRVKPVYTQRKGTPLLWYHFISKVVLLQEILTSFAAMGELHNIFSGIFTILFCVAVIILLFATLLWMNNWKWKGVLMFLGLYLFSIAVFIIVMFLYIFLGIPVPKQIPYAILVYTFGLWLNWIYFYKRRLLFEPLPNISQEDMPPVMDTNREKALAGLEEEAEQRR